MSAHKGKQQSKRNLRRMTKQELRSKRFFKHEKLTVSPVPFLILTTRSIQFEIQLN
jgi:hypothetical protein